VKCKQWCRESGRITKARTSVMCYNTQLRASWLAKTSSNFFFDVAASTSGVQSVAVLCSV
jgi:hypothetical protein